MWCNITKEPYAALSFVNTMNISINVCLVRLNADNTRLNCYKITTLNADKTKWSNWEKKTSKKIQICFVICKLWVYNYVKHLSIVAVMVAGFSCLLSRCLFTVSICRQSVHVKIWLSHVSGCTLIFVVDCCWSGGCAAFVLLKLHQWRQNKNQDRPPIDQYNGRFSLHHSFVFFLFTRIRSTHFVRMNNMVYVHGWLSHQMQLCKKQQQWTTEKRSEKKREKETYGGNNRINTS